MNARDAIGLDPGACTSCLLCVRECPAWCIELASHPEQVSEPGARRPRTVNVLDAFSIDFGLCMFCGICIEVCPCDALAWSSNAPGAADNRNALVLGIADLAERFPHPSGDRPDEA